MPFLGAHQSISGGLYKAFERIALVGGKSLQIFTRNQRQWQAAPLQSDEIALFSEKWAENGRMPVASHASYLINLGSNKKANAEKSVSAFAAELDRCRQLAIPYVVIHPGSHGGAGVEKGLATVLGNLERAMEMSGALDANLKVLLETTAGQGTSLGSRFEELAWLLQQCRFPSHLGICLDTCHIFAAGYDMASKKGYGKVITEFDRIIGCRHIYFFHLNDSKKPCGSRVDRHEHIGKGLLGLDGITGLLNDPRFQEHPMTIETPKGKDLVEDIDNLTTLRALLC